MHISLEQLFLNAVSALGIEAPSIGFEAPKMKAHGDVSTNLAMTLAKSLGKSPRAIAQSIVDHLVVDPEYVSSVEIAGAGFINLRLTPKFYAERLHSLLQLDETFGRNTIGQGKSANVEYVSANPTGPLHPGHGRNIMLGDTIARLLEWNGYSVVREYYFNNAGNQMNNLARSVYARYRQLLGEKDYPFDEENGYKGEYIHLIAQELIDERGDALREGREEDLAVCKAKGEAWCFASIQKTLERLDVRHDVFFNEHSLYTEGSIDAVVADLKAKDLAYEKDGAWWIATSQLGLENDRVIIKSTGEPTYRLPDMAYHKIKCERGDEVIVDIFGADHLATVQEVLAGVKALGCDTSKIKVIIHQMVSFLKDGQPYKLSKRNGEQYTLDDLMNDLGVDVVRFFFLMRSADTQLVFDMSLALEQSDKNPVFYLQYAHARLNSVFLNAAEKGLALSDSANLELLTHESELDLIKILDRFPMIVRRAGQSLEPHIVADYLRDVAAAFHVFYHDCRIIGVEPDLGQARLHLARAAQRVLKNGLQVLGITAPEKM